MKKSELRQIIRKSIKEAINEADLSPAEQAAKQAELTAITKQIAALNAKKSDLTSGRTPVVSENHLDELANVAIVYELAPGVDPNDYKGKKYKILAKMKELDTPISKIDLAYELGYDKQQPVNSDFMDLVVNKKIVPVGSEEQEAPRAKADDFNPIKTHTVKMKSLAGYDDVTGDEEDEEDDYEEEPTDEFDFIVGDMSDEEVDAMFDKLRASAREEEPTFSTTDAASDKDYQAFMKYTDLEARLNKVKGDIFKLRRSKTMAGDLKDKPSDEVKRLLDLKTSLQQRMDDLVANSEYLQKRQAKNKPSDEEPTKEEPIDEWFMEQLKYRAGIIK